MTKDQQLKAYLTIENLSDQSVAYKVKTTAPKVYVVKPNQGILDQGSKINIDISLINQTVTLVPLRGRTTKLMRISSWCKQLSVPSSPQKYNIMDCNRYQNYALTKFWESEVKKADIK